MVAGRYFAGYYSAQSEERSQGSHQSLPGEVGGGGGGVMLKSLPGNASTSTIEQGKTAHNEGEIRWRENIFIFSKKIKNLLLRLLAL